MAYAPTGSFLTINALAYALDGSTSSSAEEVKTNSGSHGVDMRQIAKRYQGTLGVNDDDPTEFSLGDFGVDKFQSCVVDPTGRVTESPSGGTTVNEGVTSIFFARVQNCGTQWTSSLGGDENNWSWTLNVNAPYTAEVGDISFTNAHANCSASFSTIQDADGDNDTVLVSYTYTDDYNVSASNYNTQVSNTITIVDTYTPGGGGGCFALNTMVSKSDGTSVQMDDLEIGDEVVSFGYQDMIDESDSDDYRGYTTHSLSTGFYTSSFVKDMTYTYLDSYYHINNSIKVSDLHSFWVSGSDNMWSWKTADKMSVGDWFLSDNKKVVQVSSSILINDELEAMFVNVEDVDTLFVEGVLVHNAKD
tara:strand:- start:947 stop:2029 length:1083 start_codon:yes stop_codon:yes gene_type:complete